MSSDSKIEIFSFYCFYPFRKMVGATKTKHGAFEIYGDECREDFNCNEIFDESFPFIISLRSLLFKRIYASYFTDEEAKNLISSLRCYEYVTRICDTKELFGHLTVFHRMFATMSFVLFLCDLLNSDIYENCHFIWAMYFDKFVEEFYEKGGWGKLKAEAKTYEYLILFGFQFEGRKFSLRATKEGILNYFRFKKTLKYHKRKHKGPIHISNLWINYSIEHLENYINIPSSFEFTVNAYEAELILKDLKTLLDPLNLDVHDFEKSKEKNEGYIVSFKKLELHCDDASVSEELETNRVSDAKETKTHDYSETESLDFLHESKILYRIPGEILDIPSGFDDQIRKKCTEQISEKEMLTFETSNKNGNFEFNNSTSREIEFLTQTSIVDSTKKLYAERNHLPVISIRSETNIKNPPDSSDSDNIFMSKSLVEKEVCRVQNFNEEKLEQEKSENTILEFSKTKDETSSENEPALKDFSSVNENVIDDNERYRNSKALEELRNEQKDPEMRIFLKMFLVLGDKEATKSVFSTLQNGEEVSENTHESSHKQKKKPKKKKSKK